MKRRVPARNPYGYTRLAHPAEVIDFEVESYLLKEERNAERITPENAG